MSEVLGFLEKLLDGAKVEWKALCDVGDFQRGKRFVKDDMTEIGVPCIHYGEMYTHYGVWAREAKAFLDEELAAKLRTARPGDVVIVSAGETIEDIGNGTAWLGADDVVIHDACFSFRSTLDPKYVSYFLRTFEFKAQIKSSISSGKISSINAEGLGRARIPVPCPDDLERSLAIQGEIVHILDKFTALAASLAVELDQRKKQYNHYRDQLLTFDEGEVEWKTLDELVETVTPPTKLKRGAYRQAGALPIVDQGANYIAGYTDEDVTPVSDGEYVIFGDHSEHIKYVDFAFVQGADGLKILRSKNALVKYLFYALQSHYRKEGNYKRHWSKAKQTLIPIPFANDAEKSHNAQAHIVAILDKFNTLTASLTEGLPREIELREKQYSYYRDHLMSFPKSDAEAA